MRKENRDDGPTRWKQHAMLPGWPHQCAGGRPSTPFMAMLQQQQYHFYRQQQEQAMWLGLPNQVYPGIPGYYHPQQFYGAGNVVPSVHQQHPQRQQQQQQAGQVEPKPKKTPCQNAWWLHVLSEMRVVDSPRGINLDIEDEQADVMEELRKTPLKQNTESGWAVDGVSPNDRNASGRQNKTSPTPPLPEAAASALPSPLMGNKTQRRGPGAALALEASSGQSHNELLRQGLPAQTSPNAETMPQRSSYGVKDRNSSPSGAESRSANILSRPRASLEHTPHTAPSFDHRQSSHDNGANTGTRHNAPSDQPDHAPIWLHDHLDGFSSPRRPSLDAFGSGGEYAEGEELQNSHPLKTSCEDTEKARKLEKRRCTNAAHYSIWGSQVLSHLQETGPAPVNSRHGWRNSYTFLVATEDTNPPAVTNVKESPPSDDESDSSSTRSSSCTTTTSGTYDDYERDGSDTDDESAYSVSPRKWPRRSNYSSLHEGGTANDQSPAVARTPHATARYGGTTRNSHVRSSFFRESSMSVMPSVRHLIESPDAPHQAIAATSAIHDNGRSLFSLEHCVEPSPSSKTGPSVSGSLTPRMLTTAETANMEDALKKIYFSNNYRTTGFAPAHTAHTTPPGETGEASSRRQSRQLGTATSTTPLEPIQDSGLMQAPVRRRMSGSAKKPSPLETSERSGCTQSSNTVALPQTAKLALKDTASCRTPFLIPRDESRSCASPTRARPPSVSKPRNTTTKLPPPMEKMKLISAARAVNASPKAHVSTSNVKAEGPTTATAAAATNAVEPPMSIKVKHPQTQSHSPTRSMLPAPNTLTEAQGSVPALTSHIDKALSTRSSLTERHSLTNGKGEVWAVAAAAAAAAMSKEKRPNSSLHAAQKKVPSAPPKTKAAPDTSTAKWDELPTAVGGSDDSRPRSARYLPVFPRNIAVKSSRNNTTANAAAPSSQAKQDPRNSDVENNTLHMSRRSSETKDGGGMVAQANPLEKTALSATGSPTTGRTARRISLLSAGRTGPQKSSIPRSNATASSPTTQAPNGTTATTNSTAVASRPKAPSTASDPVSVRVAAKPVLMTVAGKTQKIQGDLSVSNNSHDTLISTSPRPRSENRTSHLLSDNVGVPMINPSKPAGKANAAGSLTVAPRFPGVVEDMDNMEYIYY